MEVNPGELNKKIKIMLMVEGGKDEDGFEIDSEPKVIRTPWAKVTNTSGKESIKSGTDWSEVATRFLIRYSKTKLTTDMYIEYANDVYDIKYINDYEDAHDYVEIQTIKRVK